MILRSPLIRGADIFPEGLFQEDSRFGQRIEGLELDVGVSFANSAWFDSLGSWPDGRWTIHAFRGVPSVLPLPFDLALDLTTSEDELTLHDFSGTVGTSDFRVTGWLGNASALLTPDKYNLEGRVLIEGNRVDVGEVLGITLPETAGETDEQDSGAPSKPSENPLLGGRPLPALRVDIDAREVVMEPHRLPNLKGGLSLRRNGKILLDDFRVTRIGALVLNGDIDVSSEDEYEFKGTARLEAVDLEQLRLQMSIGDEPLPLGETVKGVVDGRVIIEASLQPDFTLDLEKASMRVDLAITGGRLVDFPPLEAMSDYFNNRDMKNVLLADLDIRTTMEDGIITVPRTAVGSTLGYLEIEGRHELDGFMSYSITVPNEVIGGVIRSLFTRKSEDDDIEDEILTDENTGRQRTTVNVVGTPENVMIGLGKRKRGNLERRWERRHGPRGGDEEE
jgi:hypothetical protein